jgi:hypothetical protein
MIKKCALFDTSEKTALDFYPDLGFLARALPLDGQTLTRTQSDAKSDTD